MREQMVCYYLLVAAFARAGIATHLEERIDPVKAVCYECVLRLILFQSTLAALCWPFVLTLYLYREHIRAHTEKIADRIIDRLLFPGVARRRL